MFPSKNAVDYMTEINRLFPRGPENDMSYNLSPFNQSAMGNRSSSSADSTSPESYVSTPLPRLEYYENPSLSFESPRPVIRADAPFIVRRQRPIVGRKIFTEKPEIPTQMEVKEDLWQLEDHAILHHTPPNSQILNQTPPNSRLNYNYELFPHGTRDFEFNTPARSVSTVSIDSISSNYNISPVNKFIRSPMYTQFTPPFNPIRSPRPKYPMKYTDKSQKLCTFCRKNGETPLVFMTHMIKEWVNNKQVVSCPILRSHVCSTCGATGDEAHTITYCPVVRNNNNGQQIQSATITLKSTRTMSNGKRRY